MTPSTVRRLARIHPRFHALGSQEACAVCELVWRRMLREPGFRDSLERGLADVAAGRTKRWPCVIGLHDWHLMTTGREGFVKFERCARGCGATRTRKGR